MKILIIGYNKSKIKDFLESKYETYWIDGGKYITLSMVEEYTPDYIILHGCHTILNKEIVEKYPKKIINCHGALLPHNRGAHPNVWSFIDNTPKGGTIQYINKNIDEGDIIAQREIDVYDTDTLADTYWRIRDTMEELFIEKWDSIICNDITPIKQDLKLGKLHYRKDLEKIKHLLPNGWNTPIVTLKNT